MYKYNDISGERFGRLVVLKQNGRTSDRHIIWECKCKCGNIVNVSSRDLIGGHTKSCGCFQKDATRKARYKHGDRGGRLYIVWQSMKKRCENPKDKSYKWYGAKGISVCPEWHDYLTFKKWAISNGYDENAKQWDCTIDRINPYGDYEPSNCRWASMAEQAKNKRGSAKMEGEQP